MNKLDTLKKTLSQVAGIEVDITIRGENKFTFSFEGENKEAADKIINFFGNKLKDNPTGEYDLECDMTFIYCSFKVK